MNKVMYETIENFMYDCMKDAAHDPEHIFRVLYQSLNIASKRTVNINYDVLIASCLLHDIGREEQFKNQNICHAEIGGIMAKEFLLKKAGMKMTRNMLINVFHPIDSEEIMFQKLWRQKFYLIQINWML